MSDPATDDESAPIATQTRVPPERDDPEPFATRTRVA